MLLLIITSRCQLSSVLVAGIILGKEVSYGNAYEKFKNIKLKFHFLYSVIYHRWVQQTLMRQEDDAQQVRRLEHGCWNYTKRRWWNDWWWFDDIVLRITTKMKVVLMIMSTTNSSQITLKSLLSTKLVSLNVIINLHKTKNYLSDLIKLFRLRKLFFHSDCMHHNWEYKTISVSFIVSNWKVIWTRVKRHKVQRHYS